MIEKVLSGRRGWLAGPLLIVASHASGAQTSSGPVLARTTVAFVDVSVIPMDRDRVLAHQTVVVRDGRIVAIGAASSTRVPDDASRVNGRGKFLAPGLVDMHAHLAAGTDALTDPAGRQLALYLASGVTTVRSLSSPPSALPGQLLLRARIARGEALGPTLVLAGASINGRSAKTPDDAARMVAEQKAAGFDLIKTHGMFASVEAYDSLVAAARRAGLPLVGHVTPEYGLAHAMDAGQQIEHLDGWIAATVRDGTPAPADQIVVDPAVLAGVDTNRVRALAGEFARRHLWNGPTLALFATIAGPDTPDVLAARPAMRYVPAAALAQWKAQKTDAAAQMPPDGARAFLALRDFTVRALHDSGAKLLAGSDSPQFFMTAGDGLLREVEAMAHAGLSPYAALETATRNPAEWLRRADAGTVSLGKRGDLVLLEANPLADVTNLRTLVGVMVDGRWLDAARLQALRDGVAGAANPGA